MGIIVNTIAPAIVIQRAWRLRLQKPLVKRPEPCHDCEGCHYSGVCERELALGRKCPCGGCDECSAWESIVSMPLLHFREWWLHNL
jgi:hypothetical protein